jgi:hypothetical protein
MDLGPWKTEDFEALSWHDVHIHGVRFAAFNEVEGAADLVLDIDYILKREQVEQGFRFTVCQAELRFYDAFGLKLELDYRTPSAGMCPLSIDGITREPLESPNGAKSFRWCIPINWPQGNLEFEAPSFTLTLVGKPVTGASQCLAPHERAA